MFAAYLRRQRLALVGFYLVAVLAPLVGCSRVSERSSARVGISVSANALETTPPCTTDDVVKDACSGPWRYHHWGSCLLASAAQCGWAECRHPSFGWEIRPGKICQQECDPEPPQCEPGLKARPCPRKTCREVCQADPDQPGVHRLGRGEVCGPQSCVFADPSCPLDPTPVFSPSGLSLAELQRQPQFSTQMAPQCSTCDPLPMDSPAALRSKFECLQARASDPTLAGAALGGELSSRIRVLAVLAGDQLSAAQRAAARALFEPNALAAGLACESLPSAAAPEACDPASSLPSELSYCERIAASATRAGVAWVAADTCLGLFERVNAAFAPQSPEHACVTPELVAQVSEQIRALMRNAMAALDERQSLNDALAGSDQRYPELERTLALLDRWYAAERASLALRNPSELERVAHAELAELVDALWAAAHKERATTAGLDALFTTGTPSAQEVSAALGLTAARADRLDRDVVIAAYRGPAAEIPSVMSGSEEILPKLTIDASVARGDLLLELTADAFTGLRRNLERIEPFHDLGCSVAGCGPRAIAPSLVSTSASNLWRALAALDHDAGSAAGQETLASALTRLPASDPHRPAFAAVLANQRALRSAVDAVSGEAQSVALDRANLDALRLPGLSLAALQRAAGEQARSYLATGLFGPRAEPRIHANVSAAGRQATIGAFDTAHTAFGRDVERYQSERREAVRDALAKTEADRALEAARQRLRELHRAQSILNGDVAGLSASLRNLDRGLGATADRMADIQGALDTGAFLAVSDTRRFVVHGFNGSTGAQVERRALPISQVAVSDIETGKPGVAKISADANQLVVVEASGAYSPLCSLARHNADHPHGFVAQLDDAIEYFFNPSAPALSIAPEPGMTIGPEGFQLTRDGSRTKVETADDDVKDSGAFDLALDIVGSIPVVGSFAARAANDFAGFMDPLESSSQSSQADAVRMQGGVRLPNTPFPQLPAGALLLAELPRGASDASAIRALHLVQRPSTTFVVAADSELYFVLNDVWAPDSSACAQLSPPSDANAVTVTLRVATPTTVVATETIDALRQVLDEIRVTRAGFLAQGRVLQSQLSQVSSDALSRLQTVSGFEFSGLPPVLRDLVETYLKREVAAIDIAVERQALERRATDIFVEVDALLRDLAALSGSARAATLLPVWRLRSFDEFASGNDEHSLVESAEKLGATAAETLLPILELWHPEAIAAARASSAFKQDAQALAGIMPDSDPLSLVDDLSRLLQTLRDAYAGDPITHLPNPLNQPIVGLSFKRPAGWGPGCDTCPTSSTGLPSASAARAFALWNAVEAALRQGQQVPEKPCSSDADCMALPGTRCKLDQAQPRCVRASTSVQVALEPEDVYRTEGGQATLSCFLVTPAVQQWGLYFANQSDDYDDELRQLSLSGRYVEPAARARQGFLSEGGMLDYRMTDAASLVSGMSLLYGSDEAAYRNFQELANQGLLLGRDPVGLSAFADLTIDFAPLLAMSHSFGNGIGESLDRPVSELVLFMRLDARQFASAPQGHELEGIVRTCEPKPDNPGARPVSQ